MGKAGRFGKYGEQKRFKRLRQKKVNPFPIKPLRNHIKSKFK